MTWHSGGWRPRVDEITRPLTELKDPSMLNEGTIIVPKDKLLTKLRENLTTHQAEYEEAIAGYRKEVLAKLEDTLAHVRGGGDMDVAKLMLTEPENHADDYKRVIAMLEMTTATEIKLNTTQFSQYVQDEWQWREHFAVTSASYGVGRGKK